MNNKISLNKGVVIFSIISIFCGGFLIGLITNDVFDSRHKDSYKVGVMVGAKYILYTHHFPLHNMRNTLWNKKIKDLTKEQTIILDSCQTKVFK